MIRDVQHWNTIRTDAPPMDCELERQVVALADRGLAAARVGDGDTYSIITHELVKVFEREDDAGETA